MITRWPALQVYGCAVDVSTPLEKKNGFEGVILISLGHSRRRGIHAHGVRSAKFDSDNRGHLQVFAQIGEVESLGITHGIQSKNVGKLDEERYLVSGHVRDLRERNPDVESGIVVR